MATLTVDAHREQMIALLEAGSGYAFLNMADPYLEVCSDDHYIRLMAAREYLTLGLPIPAKELIEAGITSGDAPPEFASVVDSLATVRGSAHSWGKHAQRFAANLDALAARGVDPEPIRGAWTQECDRYQVYEDGRGQLQVREQDVAGRWRWLVGLADHKKVAGARQLPATENMPGPFLIERLELGWFFRRLYDATLDTFLGYSCALFVVEPSPAKLAIVLHLHDWRDILADPRVFWLLGDDWAKQFRRALDADPDLPLPRHALSLNTTDSGSASDTVRVVQSAITARERTIRDALEELEARYASRDISFWARRFDEALSGRGAPLRILAAVSTHTTFLKHSMRDAQRALQALGHGCEVLTEKTRFGILGPLTYHQACRELDPDVFLILDHLRPEFAGLIPANLPILTWDQDQLPHVFTKENLQRIAKQDFLTGCSKSMFVRAGCNPRQYLAARVPTCPEQFGGEPLTRAEQERYGCDVAYVSHASQTPLAFHEQERAGCGDPKLAQLLDTMFELLPPMLAKHRVVGWGVTETILEDACRRCQVTVDNPALKNRLAWWYLWRLGDRIFRHQALEWVADWARRRGRSFRIYGNGWDRHPTLSSFAAGPVQNGRPLLCVYRASRINLQLMPAGFIHQRAMDGLAAGGFFLTRLATGDLGGATIRRLAQRIGDLGLSYTHQLLATTDPELRRLLAGHFGDFLPRVDAGRDDLLHDILINAELPYSDELFPQFSEIAFDSAAEFARLADRFVADEAARRRLAEEMRRIVVEHLSYRPTMHRFLHAMAIYLKEASFESTVLANRGELLATGGK